MFKCHVLLSSTLFTLVMANNGVAQKRSVTFLSRVDHLVYATPDLSRGIDEIEKLLGVRATLGGQHPGRGTRNALIALGPTAYLEILAPDPDQPPPKEPRAFGLDGLKKSKLVAWYIKGSNVQRMRDEAVSKGVPYGEVKSGSRRTPDGEQLSWQFTDPARRVADGIVPLIIDWGRSPHPASTAAKGASLAGLRLEHPDGRRVRQMLRQIGLDLAVERGSRPALIAVIECARGRVELR